MELTELPKEAFKVEQRWIDDKNFKLPNKKVKLDDEAFNLFFYWIHERQEIWYKRNVLGEKAPWTSDRILRDFRFTHPIRDIDKVTVFYRENILSRLNDDTRESKMNLLFNTAVFRIFNKPDVWSCIGYIDLFNDDVLARLKEGKRKALEFASEGNFLFTGAFMVNPMMNIRRYYKNLEVPLKEVKADNAFLVMRYVYENIELLYTMGIENATSMKDQLTVFQTIPGVGHFNAYEWACDICLAERYNGIKVVEWNDNSDTNLGPGAKRGITYIFKDLGNLSHRNALFLLASIAEHTFNEYGYGETMKWPEGINEFNLRIIEHSLCEFHKYNKTRLGSGKPRQTFPKGLGVH